MVDNFALVLTHGLILLAVWRLMSRADLDVEPAPGEAAGADAPRGPRSGKRGG